ncbi:hypothetical protein QNO07_06215 [Streptomyces sp. 549]|uniref:hypothetical protein n=1 Tax=Streptomyces sp. 549 TaxID=3049076 RepID=UPI0024C303F3|nr:hypothetical protein [Streptomyces sp. 549]MDK1473022.1 hypothetical protein [Streptomyces sp. 549]
MSEYQYYHFLAVDRPLSERQQAELRRISSRAQITARRMVNSYEWGDFEGDPVALVERYFDAYLYFANWGSRRLLLRVPAARVPLMAVDSYQRDDADGSLTAHCSGAHTVIDLTSEDEDGTGEAWWVREADWDDEDDNGALGQLAGIRAELCRGDLRALAVAGGAPAATAPQRALAAFLRLPSG